MVFIVGPQLNLNAVKKQADNGKLQAKKMLLELLDEGLISNTQKWNIIQEYMLENNYPNSFDVYAGPVFTVFKQEHAQVTFSWTEKLPYVERYVQEGPIDEFLVDAAKQLAFYYETNGKLKEADQILLHAIERSFNSQNSDWMHKELQFERVKIAINHAHYSEAEQLLNDMVNTMDSEDYQFQAEIKQKKIEIMAKQGKINDALKEVKIVLQGYEEKWEREKEAEQEIEEETPIVYEQLLTMKKNLQKAVTDKKDKTATVKGRIVYSDGTPAASVGVFLRTETYVNQSVGADEPYQQITDKNGFFEINGVIPGSYQICLGFMFDQIDGWTWPIDMDDWIDVGDEKEITYNITLEKLIEIETPANQQEITTQHVHFSWEEVEEAAYYQLNLGVAIDSTSGSVSTIFKSHIKDNHITVPIEELYNQPVSILMSENKLSSVEPESILAFTDTENRLFWSVQAYRADGTLISRSDGYRLNEETIGNLPFFYLKERELTKADRLLRNRKIDQALTVYKDNYKKDTNDIHSLRMITRIIGVEAMNSNHNEMVLPYWQALANKTSSPQSLFELVDYYYEKQDWDLFQQWFDRYVDSVGGHLDDYTQGVYASALMKQGYMQEASEQFHDVMKSDKSHRFIGNWLAVEVYLGKPFDRLIAIAKEYPERPLGSEEPNNWIELIKRLQKESKEKEQYRQEFKDVLDLYFKKKEEQLTNWMDNTDKGAMKDFIKAVQDIQ